MNDYMDLEALIFHLESNPFRYEFSFQISQLFQIIRDKNINNKNDVAKKAQLEMEAFAFHLQDGVVKPFYIFPDENGKDIEYPKLSNYSDEALGYLEERMDKSENAFLKSRYAHIPWCSPKKHGRYAIIALDSYLELAEQYQIEYMEKGNFDDELLETIKNLYFMAKNIKDITKLSLIKVRLHSLIPIFDVRRRQNFKLWVPLAELMLKEGSVFSKEDLIGIDTLCFIAGDNLKKSKNLNYAIFIFELGKRLEDKMGTKTYRWEEQIASCYEELMVQSKESLVAILHCQKAIDFYKKAKNFGKVDLLEAKYVNLKSSLNLRCFKYNLDMSDIFKFCSEVTDDVLKNDANYIIGFLMNYDHLLPRLHEMDKMVENQMKQFVFITLFPTAILDDRGHTAEHVSTKEEHKYNQILFNYNIAININTIPMLNSILFKAIQLNKLSLDDLLKFFGQYSWFGRTITKNLPNGNSKTYNWLNYLIPSLNDYFTVMNYHLITGNTPNFVLSIDSLTLKIEGLLRDFCEFNKIKTFYSIKDKLGRSIAREKDINMLLHEEAIKHIIGEDDLLFFKYLLVEKAGLNLRHNIAHSLIRYDQYNINTIHLLILALLRLGRYNFKE